MDFIQSLVTVGLIIAFFFGQLLRINLGFVNFPGLDIFIVLLALVNAIQTRFKTSNKFLSAFIIFSWTNLFFHILVNHHPYLTPAFYLLRLTAILSFFIFTSPKNILSKNTKNFFILALIANIIFGLFQYIFWPDLTYFKALNWDDHLYRLVSTFLDPTFTGLIYLLFIIWLFFQKQRNYLLLFIAYLAMALTYSRSTLLSLVIASAFTAISLKNIKIFIITALLVGLTIVTLPRLEGEGTKLERTSSINAKILNYQQAWQTFTKSPLIGHGYNALPYIIDTKPESHSSSGFDGSLMTILATSGIFGFLLFIFGIKNTFLSFDLTKKTMLIAVLVHSLFANSLLYPWTLLCLALF